MLLMFSYVRITYDLVEDRMAVAHLIFYVYSAASCEFKGIVQQDFSHQTN